ncbi:MAG: acyl--CoA ligase, partial [Candidatus Heimdallarchaeota archaeon]|nr:acyl--CoA ligase [Candidatus Heimdallarchaeota archaeon]MCK5144550.1 acyl--CoA ligase [Candidatus Heimdallarchaeota archaeon]
MNESSWRERMPLKIDYPDKSVFEYFVEISKGFDDNKILFKEGSKVYTAKEIIEKTNKLAFFLDASSIEKDETVAILLPNSIGMIVSIFASFQIGAKVTLINTRLSQREIAFQLRDSESKVLITD